MIDNTHTSQNPASKQPAPKLPSNFDVLTFTAACPSCGALVEFVSLGSVMAVCEYCQTTVLREGDALRAQGKQSLTIEDYSPLQIGSVGRFADDDFAIIGRIQLQYGQGVWNEWYLQFANGQNGWLSDALGQYSISLGDGEDSSLPEFDNLAINDTVEYQGVIYQVNDRREANAIAGEGELPFIMGDGWQTWVIDAQYKRKFITLDYANNGPNSSPKVFKGELVPLDALQMQLLKNNQQVSEQVSSSSSLTESDNFVHISKIECPNCGSPIPYVEGATDYLMCPACHSESKLTDSKAELIKIHSAMQHFDSTLSLGAKARILASDIVEVSEFALAEDEKAAISVGDTYHNYVVIGIMRLNEVGEFSTWTEYLLYSLTDGFLWLSEESSDWFVARVLSEMPTYGIGQLTFDNRQWQQVDSGYRNRVIFAIGAFNWQVKIDDSDLLIDYANGEELITSELTEREITYTRAKPVSFDKLQEWFGLNRESSNVAVGHDFSVPGSLKKMLGWHVILQVIAWLLSGGSFVVGIIGAILIFITYFKASESAKAHVSDEVSVGPFNYHSTGAQGFSIILIIISLFVSIMMGALSAPSPTGPASQEEATRGGGGVIIIPGGFSGSSSNSSNSSNGSNGRTGYSSGGSHK